MVSSFESVSSELSCLGPWDRAWGSGWLLAFSLDDALLEFGFGSLRLGVGRHLSCWCLAWCFVSGFDVGVHALVSLTFEVYRHCLNLASALSHEQLQVTERINPRARRRKPKPKPTPSTNDKAISETQLQAKPQICNSNPKKPKNLCAENLKRSVGTAIYGAKRQTCCVYRS